MAFDLWDLSLGHAVSDAVSLFSEVDGRAIPIWTKRQIKFSNNFNIE